MAWLYKRVERRTMGRTRLTSSITFPSYFMANITRLRNVCYRSGEFCVCKLFVSTYAGLVWRNPYIPGGDAVCLTGNIIMGGTGLFVLFGPFFHFLCHILHPHTVNNHQTCHQPLKFKYHSAAKEGYIQRNQADSHAASSAI